MVSNNVKTTAHPHVRVASRGVVLLQTFMPVSAGPKLTRDALGFSLVVYLVLARIAALQLVEKRV